MNTPTIEPVHSRDGKTYWIEQGDTLYQQRLRGGQYQKSNWQFAKRVLPRTRQCIDCGSNNAVNAVNYADTFDFVHCFEPTPLAQQLWRNTVRDCGVRNVELHTVALGEQATETEILLHPRNGGHNHLQHWDKNPRSRGEAASSKQTHRVAVKTLDSFEFDAVDFIKVDVEGYEWFVLQGAEQTILKHRPLLQLEIVAHQCRKFNYWAEEMIQWIVERGYRVASKRDGWLNKPIETKNQQLHHNSIPRKGDMDLFFIPKEWPVKLHCATTTFGDLFETE